MVIYNKIVRDKIPEIMLEKGEKPNIEILDNERYIKELDKKLNEEVKEYQESKEIEELADIMEVIYAISNARGCSEEQLNSKRSEKLKKRGGFKKRLFLISKE